MLNPHLAIVLSLALGTAPVIAQSTQSQTPNTSQHHQAVRPDVPSWFVTLQPSSSDTTSTQIRRSRDQKHILIGAFEPVDQLPGKSVLLRIGGSSDFLPHSSSPTEQSDLIATGQLTGGRSFLTSDRRNIYSEAYFRVASLIKGRAKRGSILTIEQDGGTVRLEDGRLARKLPTGGTYPLEMARPYLLFLRYQPATEDYVVVAAWDTSEDLAHELTPDGHRIPEGNSAESPMTPSDLIAAVRQKATEGVQK